MIEGLKRNTNNKIKLRSGATSLFDVRRWTFDVHFFSPFFPCRDHLLLKPNITIFRFIPSSYLISAPLSPHFFSLFPKVRP